LGYSLRESQKSTYRGKLMDEHVQTDSDSQGPIQPGVGRSDQTNRSIAQINPNWVEDGYGIVGPQRPVIPQPLSRPPPMEFGIDNSFPLNEPNSKCVPSGPHATGTWVWGSVAGKCKWIATTTCS